MKNQFFSIANIEPNLIEDFNKAFVPHLMEGKHSDLMNLI